MLRTTVVAAAAAIVVRGLGVHRCRSWTLLGGGESFGRRRRYVWGFQPDGNNTTILMKIITGRANNHGLYLHGFAPWVRQYSGRPFLASQQKKKLLNPSNIFFHHVTLPDFGKSLHCPLASSSNTALSVCRRLRLRTYPAVASICTPSTRICRSTGVEK